MKKYWHYFYSYKQDNLPPLYGCKRSISRALIGGTWQPYSMMRETITKIRPGHCSGWDDVKYLGHTPGDWSFLEINGRRQGE